MKAKPTTKEQLVYFLHNHISLGTYDQRFIENLVSMYISTLQPVTSNQHALLNKIILRYERQLRKEEIDATEMTTLPWKIEPIESSPKYTQAYVDLHDTNIEVRSPFKSEFIKEFKTFPSASWNREEKVWSIPLYENSLRQVLALVEKHYVDTNYSDEINNILSDMESFKSATTWNPTLVNNNEFFYIAASNKFIDEAVSHIKLSGTPECVASLLYYGVEISPEILKDLNLTQAEYKFLIEREPTIELNPSEIISKLQMVGVDYVLLRERSSVNKKAIDQLLRDLTDANIQVDILDHKKMPSIEVIRKAKLPVLIGGYSFSTPLNSMFAKVIGLVNNNPIEIK